MSFEVPPPKDCIECGGGAIHHRLVYISIFLDGILGSLFAPAGLQQWVARSFGSTKRPRTPRLFAFLTWLGIAKKQEKPDDHTMLLAKMLWEEADARGISMWEFRLFNLPRNIFVAMLPSGKTIAFEGIPLPPESIDRVLWMDDKGVLKKEFKKLGLPVARGGVAFTRAGAERIFEEIQGTVIVKPHSGSASRHTTLHIDNLAELGRAFAIAKQVSPFVVVEEELSGAVYRATVVNGTFAAFLRRDPPHVVGDGVLTIRELVEKENMHPARGGPYFSKMKLDSAATKELLWQGLTSTSVPEKGRYVTLHQKVNWSLGGTTADATEHVHPDNVALFEEATRVLKASISGIDFIIENPSVSWKEQQRCGILECNSMPFFDNHHLPFEGEPRNVAARIWDMVS
ncbi:MAG: hypothetical protein WAV21_03015 [Minisyncoccia bacterium]